MVYNIKINNRRFESTESKISGSDLLKIADLSLTEEYEILYKVNEKGFVPIQLDELVDLKTPGIEGFFIKPYKKISIKVDDSCYEVEECFMTPIEIMNIADVDYNSFYLVEFRNGNKEVSYKDDLEHKIRISNKSCFKTCKVERQIDCIIVNGRPKSWSKDKISFEEVVILAFGNISANPNTIYTLNYIGGIPTKPQGTMLKGGIISVNNKMIFNVTETDKS